MNEEIRGFKLNYTKIKNAVHKCELEKSEKNKSDECRKIFKDLNIEIIEFKNNKLYNWNFI